MFKKYNFFIFDDRIRIENDDPSVWVEIHKDILNYESIKNGIKGLKNKIKWIEILSKDISKEEALKEFKEYILSNQ